MLTVKLGTRKSALALTQSRTVAHSLEALNPDLRVEIVAVATRGDTDPTSLARLGGSGVFAAALRQSLLHHECDLAVHSYKDLPTLPTPGLRIAAVPPRVDPRDALCAREGKTSSSLALAPGARVGTGSPRRAAQLLAARPDLKIVDLRGNVPTRLSRVFGSVVNADGSLGAKRNPDLDAVILAVAGLQRLGLQKYVSTIFSADAASAPPYMLPAAAQGALAIEVRDDYAAELPDLAAALRQINDPLTRACVRAERSLMRALNAGCAAPVGALATPVPPAGAAATANPVICLQALICALDGARLVRAQRSCPATQAETLGAQVAQELLENGGAKIADLQATNHAS